MLTNYRHLTLSDRIEIEKLLDSGHSQTMTAQKVGCHRSTISREIRRRSWSPERAHANLRPYLRNKLDTRMPRERIYCQAPGLVEVRLDPFHRCDGRGGAVQEFVFNLDWWPVADLTVEPAMVEPVDIFGRRDLKVVDAPPRSFVAD